MKYVLVQDCLFHNKGEFFTIKKGSVYEDVHHTKMSNSMKRSISDVKKYGSHTDRWIVLFAEGKERMFIVGKDVKPLR